MRPIPFALTPFNPGSFVSGRAEELPPTLEGKTEGPPDRRFL